MSAVTTDTEVPTRTLELSIGGMTCASCAARVEKKLNKLDGVMATVNYATERAKVTYSEAVSPETLVQTVEATGYTATVPASTASLSVPGFETEVFSYFSDVPFLSKWGTPLLLGPGTIHVAHTDHEHIAVADLERAVGMYADLATSLLQP